jgi:hypothetical protein
MNEEKHIGTIEAIAKRRNAIAAKLPVCAMAESKR